MQVVDTLGEVEISPKTKVVVSILSTSLKGKYKVDIRLWYKNFEGAWLPTRKGITVSTDKKQELITILSKHGILL